MRAKKHEEPENHERWLVSYADFITLLFAFFVVLYATSTQNEEKEKSFEESIRANFRLAGGVGPGQAPGTGSILSQAFDPLDMIQRRDVENSELKKYIGTLLEKNLTEKEQKSTLGGISHDRSGVRISLNASTLFPSGSSKLRLPALKSLDKIAAILKVSNRDIIIEGHTDNRPLTGGNLESNWELGSLRATSVVRYLTKYHKIDPKRLGAASFADQRPLVDNDSEANRAKNRRIEILILNNGSGF